MHFTEQYRVQQLLFPKGLLQWRYLWISFCFFLLLISPLPLFLLRLFLNADCDPLNWFHGSFMGYTLQSIENTNLKSPNFWAFTRKWTYFVWQITALCSHQAVRTGTSSALYRMVMLFLAQSKGISDTHFFFLRIICLPTHQMSVGGHCQPGGQL